MRWPLRLCCLLTVYLLAFGQDLPNPAATEIDPKLPNGKSQKAEMAKTDYKNNLKDVRRLAELANEVKNELEATDQFVVSLKTLKKLEEIEKTAKSIRGRWLRY